jgi:hypothetical protein
MSLLVNMNDRREAGPVQPAYPVYVDLLAPRDHACPAGDYARGWPNLAQAGNFGSLGPAGARQSIVRGAGLCLLPSARECPQPRQA